MTFLCKLAFSNGGEPSKPQPFPVNKQPSADASWVLADLVVEEVNSYATKVVKLPGSLCR